MKRLLIASAAAAFLTTGGLAIAQTSTHSTAPAATHAATTTGATHKSRTMSRSDEKDILEQKLKAGGDRADYAKIIADNGWKISAINEDKPEYLEYEIVKGKHSLEVHLNFKDGSKKATDIDVASNMWRADSTKQMEKDNNWKPAKPLVADTTGKYSDSRYMKDWTSEKEKIQAALPANLKAADYRKKLEQMGYKVTSVNDREKDYVEYEIVKGNNSYEVQIDRDPKTQLATKVEVDTNVWDAEGTDKAKDANAAKKKS